MSSQERRGIIFDWIGTLVSRDGTPITHALEILTLLTQSGLYDVSVISQASNPERRIRDIHASTLNPYITYSRATPQKTPQSYQDMMGLMQTESRSTTVIDDRTIRGIQIGNQLGCRTIWFKNGEHARELPTRETGQPTKTITSLSELIGLLLQ